MAHFVKTIIHEPNIKDIESVVGIVRETILSHTTIHETNFHASREYANIYFDEGENDGMRSMMVSTGFDSDHCYCEPPLPGKKAVISLGAGRYGKSDKSGEEWVKLIGESLHQAIGGTAYFMDDYSNEGNPVPL